MIFNACKKYNTPSKTTHQKKTPPMILLNDSVLFFSYSLKFRLNVTKSFFNKTAVYLNFNAVITDCHIKFFLCQFN